MLWINIKNNLKLMLRNKFIIILMIVAPIIVIAAVSSAFDSVLEGDYKSENLVIGVNTQNESLLSEALKNVKDNTDTDIELISMDSVKGEEELKSKNIDAFIEESDDRVVIHSLSEASIAANICQYVIETIYNKAEAEVTTMVLASMNEEEGSVSISTGVLEGILLPGSVQYYGFIELIYFLFSGVLYIAFPVNSERQNRINRRYLASPASNFAIYLSKFIPCELMSIIGTTITAVITTLLFDLEWNYLFKTVLLLLVISLAGNAMGMVLLYLFKNLAITIVLDFTLIWVWGFIGGSFEPFMFREYSKSLTLFSPLYYANRAVVEVAANGRSDYFSSCIIYMLCLTVVCTGLGLLLMKRQMEVE